MTSLELLMRTLRDALKSETRAEMEERYLAQSSDHEDFENRVRELLARRSPRLSRLSIQLAAAGR